MAQSTAFLFLLGLFCFCFCQSALPPSCSSDVYCKGPLLHAVQTARIFRDSKTFVDLKMIKSQSETLEDFDELLNNTDNNPTKSQLEQFVSEHFEEGNELMKWTPTDFQTDPPLLNKIKDKNFQKFAKDLVGIWPTLARKVGPEVDEFPDRHSLISIPNGFIIPGGRFKEVYYWDSYWIIEGLILSGMTETAKGMIENFLYLVKTFKHIPNGSRVYYSERSQPPLLTAMVSKYMEATNDTDWLRSNLPTIEEELYFWSDNRMVDVVVNGKNYVLLRYSAESEGPRPESYAEDYAFASEIRDSGKQQEFYSDMKSAAESGWDFSSRWFINENGSNVGNLTDVKTRRLITVDLNAIYAAALEKVGDFNSMLGQNRAAKKWWMLAEYMRNAIDTVLWNEEDGVWYDFDIKLNQHRRNFHPSNVAPLWMDCIDTDKLQHHGPKVVEYLKRSGGLSYPGGIPSSVSRTGEQWDLPNAWPPLQSMVVQALKNINTKESNELALEMAQKWVRANYKGFKKSEEMFEKYDAERPGEYGGGGEYVVQSGFGWTNGVVLEMLDQYGDIMSSEETSQFGEH